MSYFAERGICSGRFGMGGYCKHSLAEKGKDLCFQNEDEQNVEIAR